MKRRKIIFKLAFISGDGLEWDNCFQFYRYKNKRRGKVEKGLEKIPTLLVAALQVVRGLNKTA